MPVVSWMPTAGDGLCITDKSSRMFNINTDGAEFNYIQRNDLL
jgi:hypothetical protein